MLSAASKFSTSDLTLRAAVVAGAAVFVLVLLGRGKPARRRWWIPRAWRPPAEVLEVEQLAVPLYRRTPWYRRVWAAVTSSVLSLVLGCLLAIAVSLAAIYLVTSLTDLLKQ
jgi:hypothetical protein